MLRLILLVLLLVAPSWGAISTPTAVDISLSSCSGTCSTSVTVPALTNGVVLFIGGLRTNGADVTEVVCSLGGQNLPRIAGTVNATSATAAYQGLQTLLTTIGTGSKTFECNNTAGLNDLRSLSGHVVFFEGADQAGAEATASAGTTTATSYSVNLTVSTDALLIVSTTHSADPGTVTYTPNTILGSEILSDARWNEAAYRFEPTPSNPETIGLSWVNSVSTRGIVGLSYAPAAEEFTVEYSSAGIFFKRKSSKGPFRIQPLTLSDAEEETAYTGETPLVQSGNSPFTFAVVGTLPTGLSISSTTGVISGTPAAASAGTYPFTLKVTDDDGGLAFRDVSLTVQNAGGGAFSLYEDVEDTNISELETPGGCSATNTSALEGSWELTKDSATACVWFTGANKQELFFGFDFKLSACPATTQDKMWEVRGASGEFLASCRVETDCDLWCKTDGQTENSGRGHFVVNGPAEDPTTTSKYIELHLAIDPAGLGTTFRTKKDGGNLKEFTAGTASVNIDTVEFLNDANNIHDRVEAKESSFPDRGPLPPGETPPDEPWISGFSPLRTHYVDDIACGGAGTIGDPECPSTAFSSSHYQCGDQHNLRAGRYLDTFALHTEFSRDCTESNPAVFKGYVDPATGQPEDVNFRPTIQQPGAWNWFVNIHIDGEENFAAGELSTIRMEEAGNHLINSVVHDSRGPVVRWFSTASATPDMVVYGTVIYGAGEGNNGAHNVYTQNDCSISGRKYFVHNIDLEPRSAVGGRRLFQAYDGGGGQFVCGYWLEENFFGDSTGELGHTVLFQQPDGTPTPDITLKNNYFVDFRHASSLAESVRVGHGMATQVEATGNYFARANMALNGYWGNSGTHSANVFTGNEIYDPPGSNHIRLITRGSTGSAGTHKILDADDVDNNTYGGTFRAENLECNNSDFTNLTLAQWRTNTDACRVTPASAVGFDINSTEVANPTVNKIEVIQNQYQCPNCVFTDGDWGFIYLVNWENVASDEVDISSVVGVGKDYTIRYPRDFHGTAAASGTCPGAGACNVTLPTRRTSGEAAGEFTNAYVITAEP